MKFLITLKDTKSTGYTVINPECGINPLLLDEYICNNEAEEIILEDILEFVPITSVFAFLKKIESKLRHNGLLVITGTDVKIVTWAYYMGIIDTLQYNKLVYGSQDNPWGFRQSLVSLDELNNILNELRIKVIKKEIHNDTLSFVITGVRQ